MKTLVLVWLAVVGFSFGQQSEADRFLAAYAKSEQQAVAKYPDVAVAGSALHAMVLKLDKAWKDAADPRYHSANKPMLLCEIAAKELGVAPVSTTKQNSSAEQSEAQRQAEIQRANNAASDGFQRHAEEYRKRLEQERQNQAERDAELKDQELERRLQKLEKDEHDRKNRERSPWGN